MRTAKGRGWTRWSCTGHTAAGQIHHARRAERARSGKPGGGRRGPLSLFLVPNIPSAPSFSSSSLSSPWRRLLPRPRSSLQPQWQSSSPWTAPPRPWHPAPAGITQQRSSLAGAMMRPRVGRSYRRQGDLEASNGDEGGAASPAQPADSAPADSSTTHICSSSLSLSCDLDVIQIVLAILQLNCYG